MRKLLNTVLLCLPALALLAQQKQISKDVSTFKDYSTKLEWERQADERKKDYLHADTLIEQWLHRYNVQPDSTKKAFKHLEINMYYNRACYEAQLGQKNLALDAFEAFVGLGYANYEHVIQDNDLASLRGEKRYIAALLLIWKHGYIGNALRSSGPYNRDVNKAFPAFTYQASNSPELVAFKNKYKLDSIAGYGDEISRMKNLLLWVHNTVKHDGVAGINPDVKNGMAIIELCKRENKAVNCRMLATILKDVYEAEGFKARVVTCMPKDTSDADCHVINAVWSKTLDKWVWMDPSFYAYVSDSKGNLLGIEEVRGYLYRDKLNDLILNSDANWNNVEKRTREWYLGLYMSKNLYWLQCAVSNNWDLETIKPGKPVTEYINLYPTGYNLTKNSERMMSGTRQYGTNNPGWFWQRPE